MGTVGIVAAIGFWLEKRWGLWVFLGLLAFSFLLYLVVMIIEIGEVSEAVNLSQRIVGLIFSLVLMIYLFTQRQQFKAA